MSRRTYQRIEQVPNQKEITSRVNKLEQTFNARLRNLEIKSTTRADKLENLIWELRKHVEDTWEDDTKHVKALGDKIQLTLSELKKLAQRVVDLDIKVREDCSVLYRQGSGIRKSKSQKHKSQRHKSRTHKSRRHKSRRHKK